MNPMQKLVEDFHRKFSIDIGEFPLIRKAELRASLIEEEAKETVDALRSGNLVEAIDGMCDLLYVVFGTAVTCGLDLEPFFDEVHRSNMKKEGGTYRQDGKLLKPPGWTKPDIEGVMSRYWKT